MSIVTVDQLLAALPSAQRALFTKVSATTAAGAFLSMFGLSGTPPAGAAAGSKNGVVPDYTTAGALGMRNPASGNTLYLAKVAGVGGNQVAYVNFYDRLWHGSGFDCSILTSQTIVQPALTRSLDYKGIEIWGECWSAWGGSATAFSVGYTNRQGASGKTATFSWPAGAPFTGQMFRFVLASGDDGVQSLQSLILTPSTGAAGNLGLLLMKPIVSLAYDVSKPISLDAFQLAMGQISSSACICGVMGCTAATSGVPIIDLTMPEG